MRFDIATLKVGPSQTGHPGTGATAALSSGHDIWHSISIEEFDMTRLFWIATALAWVTACGVQAQGFEGAQISAETLAFAEDSDFGSTTYSGGLQFGIAGGIGVGADLSYYGFRTLGLDARNATVHGIYTLNPATTAGLFIGQDSQNGVTADIYGIEGQGSFGGTTIEGYLAQIDGDGGSGTLVGVSGSLTLGQALALSGSFGQADLDGQINRLALGAEYQLGLGPTLYAELGRISADDDSENYVSIGARLAIGPNNGTTFGSRSLFDIVPGN